MARVLATGVTGYVGGRLVPELLAAGHEVVCLARSPAKLASRAWRDEVEVVAADVRDTDEVVAALEGCDAAYYLVHSMDGEGDFAQRDREMAASFRTACEQASVPRVVYLGGLGPDGSDELSEHLHSRHEVGRVLADGPTTLVELRAAVVIGSGSASFEMLRHLVEVLPVMVTPRWVRNRCQPIAIRDVLAYLVGVLDLSQEQLEPHADENNHVVLEIGGPDVLTYREMMDQFARTAGLRRRLILPINVLSPKLSSHWVGLVTPLPTGLAKPLVASLVNEVVADTSVVDELLPRECLSFDTAVGLALRRVRDLEVPSSWADAELLRPGLVARRETTPRQRARAALGHGEADVQAEPQPHDPEWAGGTLLSDERVAISEAPVEDLFAQVCSIGGDRGWPVADLLWEVRGFADTVIGGIGTRRGRRHPTALAVGDALDFWRVEVLQPDHLLRLRAEMRVPGEAWLEFETTALDDGRSLLEQRARFVPRGLWGRVYWLAMMPFHAVIFPVMARRLAEAAARPVPRRTTA